MRTKVNTSCSNSGSISQVGNSLRDGKGRGGPPLRRKPPGGRLRIPGPASSGRPPRYCAIASVAARQMTQQNVSIVRSRTVGCIRRFVTSVEVSSFKGNPLTRAMTIRIGYPPRYGSCRSTGFQTRGVIHRLEAPATKARVSTVARRSLLSGGLHRSPAYTDGGRFTIRPAGGWFHRRESVRQKRLETWGIQRMSATTASRNYRTPQQRVDPRRQAIFGRTETCPGARGQSTMMIKSR